VPDKRIKASNVMIELTIENYLSVARKVIDDNDYQRKKVIKSGIKAQLKSDLLRGCTIPPIVLAIKESSISKTLDFETFENENFVKQEFKKNNLLILDGLQRTYVMKEIEEDYHKISQQDVFKSPGEKATEIEKYNNFFNNKIRCEIYVGLSKLGILYRMLTLNTGQTTMSTRHLMEILYLDYLEMDFNGITLIRDKDNKPAGSNPNEFSFKDVLDGYYSFIEGKEVPIPRADILDNIHTLKQLDRTNEEKEDFQMFLNFFHTLLLKIIEISEDFQFDSEEYQIPELQLSAAPFGKSAFSIFKKSQALTGLGAAINNLKRNRDITVDKLFKDIINIKISDNTTGYESFKLINKHFDFIRNNSKKVGNDQRFYFKILFKNLFDPESDYHLKFDMAQENAFKRIKERLSD